MLGSALALPAVADPPGEPPAPIEWVKSHFSALHWTRSEVTVGAYRACVAAGRCTPSGDEEGCPTDAEPADLPVRCVSYAQAEAFCAWSGGRVPTDREWIMEASGDGWRSYPWGEAVVDCKRAVIVDHDAETAACGRGTVWPVCSKPDGLGASGICDLVGNVAEWTDGPGADGAPRGTPTPRGGSGAMDWIRVRSMLSKKPRPPQTTHRYGPQWLGIRCVR